jgi:hypothetical protein
MTTTSPASKKKSSAAETSAPLAPATPAPDATPASTPFSITALVLGITGIVLGQALLSIGAIVFGFIARNRELNGRLIGNWGIVLGFVGLFGGLLIGLLGIATFLPFVLFGGVGAWDVWGY